jgi:hypothetical protein
MSKMQVGPIKKAKTVKPVNPLNAAIRKQMNQMKPGEYFPIYGVQTPRELNNLRATISYFGKKDGVKTSTSFKGKTLTVEKI